MGLGASRTIGAGGRSCGIDSRRGSRGAGAACGISRIGPEADGICSDLPVSRTMGIAGRSGGGACRNVSRRGSKAVAAGCCISRIGGGAGRDGSGAGDNEGITGVWRERCSPRGASGIADGLGAAQPGWRSS